MKCNKNVLNPNSTKIQINNSNIICLFFTILVVSFMSKTKCINSDTFLLKNNERNLSIISQPLNQSIGLKLKIIKSQNVTIPLLTDKVDLDIKTLDIKLETLSKMIENYEKLGNNTNIRENKNLTSLKNKTSLEKSAPKKIKNLTKSYRYKKVIQI